MKHNMIRRINNAKILKLLYEICVIQDHDLGYITVNYCVPVLILNYPCDSVDRESWNFLES